jgi:hypothetical protein
MIIRDDLDDKYFTNASFPENAHGSEKRLGGRMALFVQTGNKRTMDDKEGRHVVVGLVHKVHSSAHRDRVWDYLGFGVAPNKRAKGNAPNSQIGAITSGDMLTRSFCWQSGLRNLDGDVAKNTFRADCGKQSLGGKRSDQFCGNMVVHKNDTSTLPCYTPRGVANGTEPTQISDHSIIDITFETPAYLR